MTGFSGFPSPMRFVFNVMRLKHALLWGHRHAAWNIVTGFVYDPPDALWGRHNEVRALCARCAWQRWRWRWCEISEHPFHPAAVLPGVDPGAPHGGPAGGGGGPV